MSYVRHLLRLRLSVSSNRLSTTRIIALAFAAIILTGALLLTLPVASRNGESCGFLTALFTATSATCVTGLILVDTFVQWSGFGQVVILSLIQIGGLGFMSIASIFAFSLHKKLGLKQRMLLAQAMSLNDMEGVVRLQTAARLQNAQNVKARVTESRNRVKHPPLQGIPRAIGG